MRHLFRRSVAQLGLLAALPALAAAQEGTTISGRVTGEGGTALAAATVSISEIGVGTLTRDDGRYSFVVPGARAARQQQLSLVARRVGYKPKRIAITLVPGAMTQDFVLESNPLQLGEVVITGAGTSSAVEKLGSVRNSVSADLIVKANESNVVQALAAKAPGVDVTSSAGDPGASSSIKIRGLRTINGSSEPLFVIDGVPLDNSSQSTTNLNPIDAGGSGQAGQQNGGEIEGTSQPNRLSDMNPDDIESVEILKGAAAGAIYGSRAANGVILITTKRGKSGQTKYALRSSYSNDDITRKYPLQTTYAQGQRGTQPTACKTTSEGLVPGACVRSWGPQISAGSAFDHASEAFRTGHQSDNVLSMSGGNDRTTFYLSGNVNDNKGVFIGPNNFYDRNTVRLNATHKLAETFNVGGNFSYADTRGHFTQRGNNVNGLLLGLLRTPPDFNNFPYLDPTSGLHRSYRLPTPDLTTASQTRGFNNPIYSLYEELNQAQANRTFGNVNADWLANNWLKFNYTLGGDYSNDERLEVCPQECSDVATGGRITEGKLVNYSIDHNLTATATYSLNDNFGGNVTLGQNLNSRSYRTFSTVGRGMIVPSLYSISNTLARDPSSDYQTLVHDESYFGQATFDLAKQLYITAAVRNDGSSTFGTANKRNWFPKASVAWNPLQVYKPSMLGFLSSLKLRYSYGEAGQEPAPYLTSQTYNLTGVTGGISQGTGFSPTQSGQGGLFFNTTRPALDLKPERTRENEGGFDLGFWGDKADFSATFYKQHTTDAILVTPTTPSSGYSSEAKNAGIISNSGTEFSLNLRPFTSANQAWDIGLGWARNQSLVEDIAGADYLFIDNATVGIVAKKGSPLGVMFGYGMVRCGLSNPDEVAGLAAACAGKPTGTLYIDDGNNCSNQPNVPCGEVLQQRVLGNPNPKWTGNVRSSYRYGKLSLSGLVDIRHGGQIHNGTKGALWSYGTHLDTQNRANCTGAFTCTGNEQTFGSANWYPGPVTGPGAGKAVSIGENWYRNDIAPCPFSGIDEQCVEDAGYVKLREISVAYSLNTGFVTRSLGLSSIDIRVAGRNLKTWTNYTGLDPETSLGGSLSKVGGADYFNLPQTRSLVFTVGLNR